MDGWWCDEGRRICGLRRWLPELYEGVDEAADCIYWSTADWPTPLQPAPYNDVNDRDIGLELVNVDDKRLDDGLDVVEDDDILGLYVDDNPDRRPSDP